MNLFSWTITTYDFFAKGFTSQQPATKLLLPTEKSLTPTAILGPRSRGAGFSPFRWAGRFSFGACRILTLPATKRGEVGAASLQVVDFFKNLRCWGWRTKSRGFLRITTVKIINDSNITLNNCWLFWLICDYRRIIRDMEEMTSHLYLK